MSRKIIGATVGTTLRPEKVVEVIPVANGTGEHAAVLNGGSPEQASGDNSTARGYRTKAFGDRSDATGDMTEAGWRSSTEGFGTYADNTSHAGGRLSKAMGKGSLANGVERTENLLVGGAQVVTTAEVALDSVTIPVNLSVEGVLAVGDFIHLFGDTMLPADCRKVIAISEDGLTITIEYPFGDVNYTTAVSGVEAANIPAGAGVRRDFGCEASGNGAVAFGQGAKASGIAAFASGFYTEAAGDYSETGGYKTKASGTSSKATGCETTASGTYSRAGGYKCKASGSRAIAEGNETEAIGVASRATGNKTKASGDYSRAGGSFCEATGLSSTAEGNRSVASGDVAFASGNKTTASGNYSNAQNMMTTAAGYSQSARGRNNIPDPDGKYVDIVGISKTDTPANGYTMDWNGNGWFAGDVYVGGAGQDDGQKLATQKYVHSARGFSLNNVVCIGDSFCDGATDGEDYVSGQGWGYYLKLMERKDNQDATFSQTAVGGTGFHQTVDDVNFYALVESQASDMTEAERNAVETVIIMGGVNDANAGIHISYDETVALAMEKFPNAKIVVGMNPMCSKYLWCEANYSDTLRHPSTYYFEQLRYPSTDPRVCVLPDSYQWLLCNPAFRCSDGLHPTVAGYQRIAAHLFWASRGLNLETNYQYDVELDVTGVTLTCCKVGNNVSFFAYGTVTQDRSYEKPDFVYLGTRPTWMSLAYDTVFPIYSNVANTALYFSGGGVFLYVPNYTGDVTFNGKAMLSLDML